MLEISRDALHHAYLLLGEDANIRSELIGILESLGVASRGNPDLHFFEEEVFGISEARQLTERAQGRAFGERKVFILFPSRITLEAQNALLKTLEDPVPNTHFFLVLREESLAIPTLRSRMQMIRISGLGGERNDARKFLELPLRKRLDFAKDFADSEKILSVFLDDLLLTLKENILDPSKLEKVYKLRLFADDRSASARLILEHLALVL